MLIEFQMGEWVNICQALQNYRIARSGSATLSFSVNLTQESTARFVISSSSLHIEWIHVCKRVESVVHIVKLNEILRLVTRGCFIYILQSSRLYFYIHLSQTELNWKITHSSSVCLVMQFWSILWPAVLHSSQTRCNAQNEICLEQISADGKRIDPIQRAVVCGV